MNFYIQTSNPHILKEFNTNDDSLSEAIETVFPMNTEELIIYWNHIGIPLSYKYDISYMIEDILKMLEYINSEAKGELVIHWLPDTFRSDWKLKWNEESIIINANWENLKGDLQKILVQPAKVELLKEDFISEWKMLLGILVNALKQNGYNHSISNQYRRLVDSFENIKDYGVLYKNN